MTNKFLHKLTDHPFKDTEINLFLRNIQAAAHERATWKGDAFSPADFFAGASLFFATFPGAGPLPQDLLHAAAGQPENDFYLPTPTEQIHRLADSVQIDIHEGVLQPDEWQPVIDTARAWLSRTLCPAGKIPPLPLDALAELLEDAELTAHYDAKNGPVDTANLQTIRTWLDALQTTRTDPA